MGDVGRMTCGIGCVADGPRGRLDAWWSDGWTAQRIALEDGCRPCRLAGEQRLSPRVAEAAVGQPRRGGKCTGEATR